MIINADVVDYGVDWITATATQGVGYQQFAEVGTKNIRREKLAGNTLHANSWQGYSGYQCGAVFIGELNGRMLIKVTSHLADEVFKDIVPHASNVSRIDLQITVRCQPPEPQLIEKARKHIINYIRAHNLPTQHRMIQDSKKGDTLYIGRRVSDRFARLYNKHTESGLEDYKNCYRFEGEYKRGVAHDTAMLLAEENDHSSVASELVESHFRRYGIVRSQATSTRPVVRLRPPGDSDATRVINWLRSGVSGSIQKLRAEGLLHEAIEALGLSDVFVCDDPNHKKKERVS